MKKRKRKASPPQPEKIPGEVRYRPPQGEEGQRPLERLRQGESPVEIVPPTAPLKR